MRLTYTPNLNFNGSDSFTFTASDGTAVSSTSTFSITVTPVNDSPTAVALSSVLTSTPENGGAIKVANIAINDVDGGDNQFAIGGADASAFEIRNFNAANDTAEIWFKGNANFESKSIYEYFVSVNDPSVGSTPDASSTTRTLTITNVSDVTTYEFGTNSNPRFYTVPGLSSDDVIRVEREGGDGFDNGSYEYRELSGSYGSYAAAKAAVDAAHSNDADNGVVVAFFTDGSSTSAVIAIDKQQNTGSAELYITVVGISANQISSSNFDID